MEILAERILLHNLGHLTAAEKFNNFQNNFFLDKININQILQLITNKFLNNFFFRKKGNNNQFFETSAACRITKILFLMLCIR